VTVDQVHSTVQRLLKGNLTFVALGGEANKLPALDKIVSSLRN